MRAPIGAVTFLFTDIEGSTELWERYPERMPRALERHDQVLRDTVGAHDGVVFKEVGDAFHAVFGDASKAAAAAIAIQRALARESWETPDPIRVRIAVHAGQAEERDGDYYGPTLNRAARILAAGHGGQILLSQAAERLVQSRFPEGAALRDLGERTLKDLRQPERIFQLVTADLEGDFPPLRTLDARPHNLPAQATGLVGRTRELSEVRRLLQREDVRLVTLTGPGGTGKTRLALQIAAELVDAFRHGVFFVNLTTVTDGDHLAPAIVQAMDVTTETGEAPEAALERHLSDREILLLLDNFEQIVRSAPAVGGLLQAAPGLTVLVTSQAALRIQGEHEYPVGPLEVPDPSCESDPEGVEGNEAVALFVERARAVRPDFELTADNAAAVIAIIRQLDGLPLAIELAAARIKLFEPEALLRRIERRFDFLTSGARDVPDRHRTLRSAIAWSYDLLEEDEKALFRRQAVFDGGFTLESAEAVCSPPEDPLDVLDGLASLVDKSLLRQRPTKAGEPRFERLRTVRAFAVECLEQSGEADRWRRRHAEHFAALAGSVSQSRVAEPEARALLDGLVAELDNIRAAISWSIAHREGGLALRLCRSWPALWFRLGALEESQEWMSRLLELGDSLTAVERAEALNLYGRERQIRGDNGPEVLRRFEESLELYRRHGEPIGIARALMNLGNAKRREEEYDAAEALFEEALAIYRERDEPFGMGGALLNLGDLNHARGDVERARALFEEARDVSRGGGSEITLAYAHQYLGTVALESGALDRAEALFEESQALFESLGSRPGATWSRYYLGAVARERGDLARARELFGEALEGARALGHEPGVALSLLAFATLEARAGACHRAAVLLGAAHALRARASISSSPLEWRGAAEVSDTCRAALGEERFAEARAEGAELSIGGAIAYALEPVALTT